MVVDNTVNLFQIADVSRLLVLANCPEDSLPILEALSRNERTVDRANGGRGIGHRDFPEPSTRSATSSTPISTRRSSRATSTTPDKHIRAGQYVSATVNIPPPDDVVEIPVDALVDDGRQSLVFVQPDAAKHQFTMRRVQVTHRFDRTVFVRDVPIPKEEQLNAPGGGRGPVAERAASAGRARAPGRFGGDSNGLCIDLESRPKSRTRNGGPHRQGEGDDAVSDVELPAQKQKPKG